MLMGLAMIVNCLENLVVLALLIRFGHVWLATGAAHCSLIMQVSIRMFMGCV